MKEVNYFNLINISWEINEYDKFDWMFFKHEGSSIFSRYSIVVDFTLFWRRVVIEF